ncbi:hypothetical protein [uncultured Methanobrevibacter sp.]|uniref:hypothetical protein n=1 Tax=uncultured Methanobrevibacter sp. TaxID=253161 RepID=UPI00260320A7|nr:hypothetical protein [uncultured Methanobrevibacter sp.]
MPIHSTYDFNGLFTIDLPMGQEYSDVSWCHSNKPLSCAAEYWEKNAGCEIDGDEAVIYYYDTSLLVGGESNVYKHAVNVLNKTYLYKIYQKDGNLLIMRNDIGMTNLPEYLVGVGSDDGSKAVFVGGYNLEKLKSYASSIKFK